MAMFLTHRRLSDHMKKDDFFRISLVTSALVFGSFYQARAQTELIVNGDFEAIPSGTGWTFAGGAGVYSDFQDGAVPRTGSYCIWLGGAPDELDSAYQTITIPSGASVVTLSFWYDIFSDDTGPVAHDTFTATIRNTSGTVLGTVTNFSNLN